MIPMDYELENPEDFLELSPGTIFLTCLNDTQNLMNGIISMKENPSQKMMDLFLDLNQLIPKIDRILSDDPEREIGSFESLIYNLKYSVTDKERNTCFTLIENFLNVAILSARNFQEQFSKMKFAPVKVAAMKDLYVRIRQEIQ